MSFNLYVWHEDQSVTAAEARAKLERWGDGVPEVFAAHPAVERFYDALLDRFPPLEIVHRPMLEEGSAPIENSEPPYVSGASDAQLVLGVGPLPRTPALRTSVCHPRAVTRAAVTAHRSQGLATRLIRAVAASTHARGETVYLHAAASNSAAIRLYEAIGFTPRRTTTFRLVRIPELGIADATTDCLYSRPGSGMFQI